MISISTFSGRSVALFGLGGSGRVTARALAAGGAQVTAFDDNPDSVAAAAAEGIGTADLHGADWSGFDALVLAPGVPLTHPKPHWTVDKARAENVPIIGDIDLFCRERAKIAPHAPFVAVTGTNGKSTTTALIAHILRRAGRDVQMGGNIGVPVLALDPPAKGRIHVLECSSFQIDLAPSLDPTVGILLNISPDHLDRHGTMENYAGIKKRLVTGARKAVIGVDDVWCRTAAEEAEGAGVSVERISAIGDRHEIDLTNAAALRGDHNRQNALAAAHACRMLGLEEADIQAGLEDFPGLEHRMQIVARRERVLFVNDSKATNANAAAKALSSFRDIHWIAGGLAKEGGIASLSPLFGRVAKAYLIGEAAPAFAATIGERLPFEISASIDVAVRRAAADAAQAEADEPVVLLAPAAASFDQFGNFEERGRAFVDAVAILDGVDAPMVPVDPVPADPGQPAEAPIVEHTTDPEPGEEIVAEAAEAVEAAEVEAGDAPADAQSAAPVAPVADMDTAESEADHREAAETPVDTQGGTDAHEDEPAPPVAAGDDDDVPALEGLDADDELARLADELERANGGGERVHEADAMGRDETLREDEDVPSQ